MLCLNPEMEKGLTYFFNFFLAGMRVIAELELLGHGSAQTASGTNLPPMFLLSPARTNLRKAGESKNIEGRRGKKGEQPGFFYWQDGAAQRSAGQSGAELKLLHGQQCGSHWVPSKGRFLLPGGILQPFYLVCTADSAEALCKQQVAHRGLFGTAPWGEPSLCTAAEGTTVN